MLLRQSAEVLKQTIKTFKIIIQAVISALKDGKPLIVVKKM